jgi:hypothetical protein
MGQIAASIFSTAKASDLGMFVAYLLSPAGNIGNNRTEFLSKYFLID